MGLLASVTDSPAFVTDAELSAADLEILRQNILALDGASYLAATAFEWRWGQGLQEFGRNPSPFWAGGFRFLTGMTTFYIYVNNASLVAGDKLRLNLYGDSITNTTDTTLTAGAQTITKTISALGFADGEVVRAEIELYNATKPATGATWGTIRLDEVVVIPVEVADSYPGVPTFGSITAANLNQLSNAVDWLTRQMGLYHRPLFAATIREKGAYGPRTGGKAGQLNVRWNGSVRRTNQHAVVAADCTILVLDGQYTETVVLKVDDTIRDTYNVPSTPGEYDFTLDYTIATAVDGISRIEILHTRTSTEAAAGVIYNPITIWHVGMQRASEPTAITISEKPARTSGTFTALQTHLNDLCTKVTAIKARIDDNADVWARQRVFKRRNALDHDQLVYFTPERISWSPGRIGESLIVRGKALRLGWGPLLLPDKPDNQETNKVLYTVKYVREEGIADGDEVETVVHYLDSFDGLPPGSAFAVLGTYAYYAAEQLLDTLQGL
jgi:hypothetical protein